MTPGEEQLEEFQAFMRAYWDLAPRTGELGRSISLSQLFATKEFWQLLLVVRSWFTTDVSADDALGEVQHILHLCVMKMNRDQGLITEDDDTRTTKGGS